MNSNNNDLKNGNNPSGTVTITSSEVTQQPPTPRQFREAMFNSAEHSERLFLAFKVVQPIFAEAINRILDQYSLTTRLKAAIQNGYKLRFLQLNCAEGLFLYELARILEEHNLLAGAELFGISGEVAHILTAELYSKQARPPRPYLNFYFHDIHQPLETCLGLHEAAKSDSDTPVTFDFIFGANETLVVTKDAKQILERLYKRNLKADGLMLFTELTLTEGKEGWIPPHPALGELLRLGLIPLASYNPGVEEVALAVKDWLGDLGAEKANLQQYKLKIAQGGYSEQGRLFLRNTIQFLSITGPQFVNAGLLSQARFEELWGTFRREIAPQHQGFAHYVITIGHKPK
jgi:hypothetical protein